MRRTYELYFALAAILIVTAAYVPFALHGAPRASGLLGHGLGVVGFGLMLMTEALYSLRKRARGRAWGQMSTWLQFHIITGIAGPYLVLLHTSWQYNGLAGVVLWLTLVVVASGFVGRYIYTAVPRTADGAEMALQELETLIAQADVRLQAWSAERPAAVTALTARLTAMADLPAEESVMLVLGRTLMRWGYQNQLRQEIARLDAAGRAQAVQLRRMLDERYRLQGQRRSLAMARRLLALWHAVHVPLGLAMFALALVHIGGAIYYATLLR